MTDPEPRPGRTWWIVALVFVSGWCLYLYFFGPTVPLTPPTLDVPALGLPADYRWKVHDLEGRPVSFEKYRGKAVFLNIWATDCPPCLEELPTIARLARSPRLARVAFVCVSTDQDDELVRQYLKGKDWPMTFLRVDANELPAAFTAEGGTRPATYLIAPDGRVAASTLGSANWDDPSVVDFLEQLAGPEPGPAGPAGPR